MASSQVSVLVLVMLLSGPCFSDAVASEGAFHGRGAFDATESTHLVHFCDETNLPPSAVRLIEREVRHPFDRAGLSLAWVSGCPDGPLGRPTAARVYVLSELLRPLLASPGFACGDARRVLGIVLTSVREPPGEVIYVSRNAIDASIQRASIAPSVPRRSRAIGRVIIHELAHRFLADTRHSTSGILRSGAIHPRELTGPSSRSFRFSDSDIERLQAVVGGE
jgi:hypothetical protein